MRRELGLSRHLEAKARMDATPQAQAGKTLEMVVGLQAWSVLLSSGNCASHNSGNASIAVSPKFIPTNPGLGQW